MTSDNKKKHFHRGHETIETEKDLWIYKETGEPVKDNPNIKCGHCNLENTPEGHDGCLGTLPGVMNACCGHGTISESYIMYSNNKILRGVVLT